MSDFGDLLAAAHGAAGRRVMLRASLHLWHHRARITAGFERWTTARQGAQASAVARAVGPARPAEEEHVVDLAARWPDRWRLEGQWMWHGPAVTVIDGPSWMAWTPENGATSNFGEAGFSHGNPAADMVDPAPLLRSEIDDLILSEANGRSTWYVHALPRNRQPAFEARWAMEHCIDDYLVHVDRETGLVISLVGRVGSEDALRYTFDDLDVGVELPEQLFSLAAPDGTTPLDARPREEPPRHLPLHQAAAEADYTVFVPTDLPEGVTIDHEPFIWHDILWISFSRPDLPQVLTLWQQRSVGDAAGLSDAGLWRTRTVRDQVIEVADPEQISSGRLRMVRGQTRLELAGRLPTEELLRVLLSIIPAATHPPRLPPA